MVRNIQMKSNLMLVTWNYPPKIGGMEQLLFQLVQQVQSDVSTFVLAPYCGDKDYINEAGISRSYRKGLLGFFWHVWVKGNHLLKTEEIDVIMGGSALVTPLVYLLSRKHNIPGTIYAHGLDLIYRNPVYQLIIRAILPRMARIFVNSSQTKLTAINIGVTENRIKIIHPGIHSAEYRSSEEQIVIRRRYSLEAKKVIMYAGRLAKRKGVLEFIKYSLPEVVRQHDDVIFCIIGGNPEKSLHHKENMRQQIEQEIEIQGLEDHVQLLGWVDRKVLLDMYSACDIFLLPAIPVPGDMEGFGIVLAEANAAGKPVVSTQIGGISDAVVDGKSAILVDPESWNEYSSAIIKLLDNPDLRIKMGEFGALRVSKELDWSFIGNEFSREIKSL